jgi:hypothetical protein
MKSAIEYLCLSTDNRHEQEEYDQLISQLSELYPCKLCASPTLRITASGTDRVCQETCERFALFAKARDGSIEAFKCRYSLSDNKIIEKARGK